MGVNVTLDEAKKILVPSSVLEELFGLKERMIRQLAEEGIINRDSHGKYLLMESVRGYVLAIKASKNNKVFQMEDGSELVLDEERAKHEHIKAQIAEIKLKLIRGQVHKAEDVETVMTDMLLKFKNKMMGFPSTLAVKLEGEDRLEIQKILEREVNDALLELAAYNPKNFYSDEHIDVSSESMEKFFSEVENDE